MISQPGLPPSTLRQSAAFGTTSMHSHGHDLCGPVRLRHSAQPQSQKLIFMSAHCSRERALCAGAVRRQPAVLSLMESLLQICFLPSVPTRLGRVIAMAHLKQPYCV